MLATIFSGRGMILILAAVLLLIGAKKLPELAKGFGLGLKEFKRATREVAEEMSDWRGGDDDPPSGTAV